MPLLFQYECGLLGARPAGQRPASRAASIAGQFGARCDDHQIATLPGTETFYSLGIRVVVVLFYPMYGINKIISDSTVHFKE